MKKKTINKVIKQKIEDWLESIEDKSLAKDLKDNVIVTGGCIASMLMNEKVNDYDVYLQNKAITVRVAQYYCKKFKGVNAIVEERGSRVKIVISSDGVAAENEEILEEPFENVIEELSEADDVVIEDGPLDNRYEPVFLSSNAITLRDKIQITIRFYGDPEEIHKNYDFVHCRNYWTFKEGLVLRQPALEAILAKELIYCGSLYPVCSIIRTRKFIKRGFHINAGQYLKMCYQVSQLDLNNLTVLEDQLVGVDSAYFHILINALKAKQKIDEEFVLNDDYLASIIDRIF